MADSTEAVLSAVMPSGVEHSARLTMRELDPSVLSAVMPSGVEHAETDALAVEAKAVLSAVMPSGVEHERWGFDRVLAICGVVGGDAFGR